MVYILFMPWQNVYLIYKKENKTNEANQKPENVRKCYTLGGMSRPGQFSNTVFEYWLNLDRDNKS